MPYSTKLYALLIRYLGDYPDDFRSYVMCLIIEEFYRITASLCSVALLAFILIDIDDFALTRSRVLHAQLSAVSRNNFGIPLATIANFHRLQGEWFRFLLESFSS